MSFNPDHSPWCVLSFRPFDEDLTNVEKSIKKYAVLQIKMYRRDVWENVVDEIIEEAMAASNKTYEKVGINKIPVPKSSKKRTEITKKIRTAVLETARGECDMDDAVREISSVDGGERAKTLLKMFRSTFCAYRRRYPDWEERKLFNTAEEFVLNIDRDHRMHIEWEQSQKVE